jgi:hypothetical protein
LAIYTIHSQSTAHEAIRDARFLRDGFSFGAFWLGPAWLARHGFYCVLAIWVATILVLAIAAATILSPGASFTVVLAIQALLGLEADHLLQAKLARKGYKLVDIVAAPNLDEAEVAFFRRHGMANRGPLPDSESYP